jgi:hypothetical protein
MTTERLDDLRHTTAGGVFGAGLAAVTGSTPIGVALVAALGGALAWRAGARRGSRAAAR